MLKKRGQGQSFSLDIILAVVVFVLILATFYTLLSTSKGNKTESLQIEANTLANNLDSSTGLNTQLAIIDKGTLSKDKITELYSEQGNYASIKQQLGIKGDFCIYLLDQNGNLITVIDPVTGNESVGFGNGNLSINDINCGNYVPLTED